MVILGAGFRLGAGYGVRWMINSWFDSLLYPVAIARLGVVLGGSVMTLLSVPFNIAQIALLDWSGKDLLLLKDLQKRSLLIERLSAKSLILGVLARILVFLILCWDDPVTVVVYFRAWKYTGLKRRDWIVLSLATIIANAYWTVRWVVIIEIVKWGWRWFHIL